MEYVRKCLDTGFVSSVGEFVREMERRMASRAGTTYAIATASGTSAIHIALLVAGVLPNDEVLMPSLTFIAPANAIRYVGAWPVFLDCDAQYWQIDPEKVLAFLERECERRASGTFNRRTGRRVAAIMPVHVLGHPAPMGAIREIARDWGLTLIEDASESLGSTVEARPTGSFGRLGCFSFNGNKIVTAGGGGMITTDEEVLAKRARYLTTQAKDDPLEYVHGTIGYNYRMTNLHAAMGCAQLERLDDFLEVKRRIAERYERALSTIRGWFMPREAPWARSNWWLYTVRIGKSAKISSRELMQALLSAKIETRPFWQPMHLSPAHRDCQSWHCEHAETLWREGLSLPCSTHLEADSQQRVIAAILRLAG
jgi:perosamine synthetase